MSAPAPLPSHLTIAQAADELQVSKDTIRRLIATGDLEAYRIGPSTNRRRPIRVDRTSLLALREPVTDLAAMKAGAVA